MDDSVVLSPSQFVAIVVGYVLTLKIGPVLMKNQRPFDLRSVLVVYNYSQIFFNIALMLGIFPLANKLTIFCQAEHNTSDEIATMRKLYDGYLLLKTYDLLDTVFFVLRKKHVQISFLHVYHHILILGGAWLMPTYFPSGRYPGGPMLSFAIINCFVHAVMYAYYLQSARAKIKNVSWKKYVTLLQLVQHYTLFLLTFNAFVSGGCPYPKPLVGFALFGAFSMVYLFTQFYCKAYRKKGKGQAEDKER